MLACGLASVVSLLVRFRRSRGVERQQLKWFTFAGAVTVAGLVLILFPSQYEWIGPVSPLVTAPILVSMPVAAGVAILRYRLYDIDRIINRTLVYGLLTALLAGVYAAAVLVLGQVFGGVRGDPPSWVVAGATLAVAALFQRARRRIQQAVDRRFNRRKYDAVKTVEAIQRPSTGRGRPEHVNGGAAGRGRPDDPADEGVVVASAIGPGFASHSSLNESAHGLCRANTSIAHLVTSSDASIGPLALASGVVVCRLLPVGCRAFTACSPPIGRLVIAGSLRVPSLAGSSCWRPTPTWP